MAVVDDDGKTEKLKEAEGEKCEKCGGKMVLKEGKFGKFLACENYPKCKNTKTVIQKTGVKCPDCGEGELIEYPGCKYASWTDPAKQDEASNEEEKENGGDEDKDKKEE